MRQMYGKNMTHFMYFGFYVSCIRDFSLVGRKVENTNKNDRRWNQPQ